MKKAARQSRRVFRAADTNGNGMLDMAEMMASMGKLIMSDDLKLVLATMFNNMDSNDDKELSRRGEICVTLKIN